MVKYSIGDMLFGRYTGNLEKILEKSGDFDTKELKLSNAATYGGCYEKDQTIDYKPLAFVNGYSKEREDRLVRCLEKKLGSPFSVKAKKTSESKDSVTYEYDAEPAFMTLFYRGGDGAKVVLTIERKDKGNINVKYTMKGNIVHRMNDKVEERPAVSPNTIKSYMNRIYAGLAKYGSGLKFAHKLTDAQKANLDAIAVKHAGEAPRGTSRPAAAEAPEHEAGEPAPAQQPAPGAPALGRVGSPQPSELGRVTPPSAPAAYQASPPITPEVVDGYNAWIKSGLENNYVPMLINRLTQNQQQESAAQGAAAGG